MLFPGTEYADLRATDTHRRAHLPAARGPLSERIIEALGSGGAVDRTPDVADADPYGDDVQLALSVAYELHYQGFAGVDEGREWDPGVLGYRVEIERRFLDAVRRDIGDVDSPVVGEMDRLCVEPLNGSGVSQLLCDSASWDQFRDYFAMRSLYHLKEADPHAWVIPRLRRHAKAAFVAVEYDEFGAGRGDAVHQELFADLLAAADLDPSYLGYLPHAPAWALAPVNLMSLFGLHRALRGAAVGHLAATEITSPTGSARVLAGLERVDAPEPCRHFYREHVEADAVHEQVLRADVVGALIDAEPDLEPDVVLGIRGFLHMEDMWETGLQQVWASGHGIVSPSR